MATLESISFLSSLLNFNISIKEQNLSHKPAHNVCSLPKQKTKRHSVGSWRPTLQPYSLAFLPTKRRKKACSEPGGLWDMDVLTWAKKLREGAERDHNHEQPFDKFNNRGLSQLSPYLSVHTCSLEANGEGYNLLWKNKMGPTDGLWIPKTRKKY